MSHIGFTLLYFKMAVMPLVPETKMVDVSKLISLGNLLVRKVTWFVFTTTSATLIFFPAILETTAWQELPINTLVFQELILFHFNSQRQYTLLHCDIQTRLTLSVSTYRDNTHFLSLSLTFDFQQSIPWNATPLCNDFLPCSTFTIRLAPASKTTTEILSNHRKKQTTNMGEYTFLQTYTIKIFWNT